ncbi:ABC transporter permease [Fulvivirgaceae bacterium BMA12]|uniref:ABC transporter permease n=1 Tax=Agaribacillus aureus TaxID=3051825 RepID=A0ABT8L6E2_9BACT|nr:ABC transporter permease [Fulvivirgaceae bacterium BMA12]
MLRNYLTVAIRNLARDKTFTLINVLGLALGMSVCLSIYQYIRFELSYDKFHRDAQNTYRLTQNEIKNGEDLGTKIYTTYALGPSGKEVIPEIEDYVRVRPWDIGPVISNPENNEIHQEDEIFYVDDNFLQMFDFQLLYGERESVLTGKYNMVISEQIAIKYFGNTNPIGKNLKVSEDPLSGEFVVTGVLKALPVNSHLQFDFLLPITFLLENYGFYRRGSGWEISDFVTYVKLAKDVDLAQVGKKFDRLIDQHGGDNLGHGSGAIKTGFQPITDVHLHSDYSADFVSNNGDIQHVHIFSIIAIFILFVAWANYISLSTARAIRRAREVGIRKSIGAQRMQLISQFLLDSFLINLVAAILSLGLAFLWLPVLNNIIGKELVLYVLEEPEFWGQLLAITIFGSILSGLYPAFILSAFKPVSMLKSAKTNLAGGFGLRKSLVVFQFLISVLLIAGTYLVYQQISFMKHKDLGVNMEKILVVNGPREILKTIKLEGSSLESKYQSFRNKATSHYTISDVSATVTVPGKGFYFTEGFWRSGKPVDSKKTGNVVIVDTDFANTYDLEYLARAPHLNEMFREEGAIINEEAVKVYGFESAEDALYETLTNGGDSLKVLGVVKNLHWNSLRDAHSPILFALNNEWGAYLSLKINLSDIPETLAHIKSSFQTVFPDDPFHYFFLEDDFNRQYQSDLQFRNLFMVFAILAIFIACLGLFALVSFSATQRVKEIGIRKVFGAGVGKLMILLSKEYAILLLIANVVAVPVIILGGKAWLANYAFKVAMGVELFLIPALASIVVSLLTVSYRTYAAANLNPANSLRSE